MTDVPEQTVWLGVEILTAGVTTPLMMIVIEFEVAVVGDAHAELEVMTQDTT